LLNRNAVHRAAAWGRGEVYGPITVDDAAIDLENEYLADGRRSIVGLRVRLKKGVRPWFGGRGMLNITTADVRAYVPCGADGVANGTINGEELSGRLTAGAVWRTPLRSLTSDIARTPPRAPRLGTQR
jgi:hypothetical protein